MKNLSFILTVFAALCFGVAVQSNFAQSLVPFGGDLDRPVSTQEADEKERDAGASNEPPVPENPEDDDEEPPPEFIGEPLEGDTFIFVIDRSGSMTARYSPGFPVYDRNGNVISYPNRWQTLQSETIGAFTSFTEEQSFEVITYATQIYICFGSLTKASSNAKSQAAGWLWSQQPTGCTNSYDALKAAFENYGPVDTIVYMTDGYPNTALSRGCGACACGQSGQWIVNEADGWMAPHRAANARFKLFVIQVGGSPIGTMVALGAKPNAEFYLK